MKSEASFDLKVKTSIFIEAVNEMLKEKYNRYSNGSFGGANKRKKRRFSERI